MTATVTLPAPPEPHLGTGLLPVTPGAVHRSGWRHRVVAIGSGFGGLTATKALKHDLVNIADVLAFLTRMTAQGTAHVHNQASLWLHVIPTTAAVFTTVGVLIALSAAIIRERKSAESLRYEIVTAAEYFSYDGRLWHSQRTRKGWR
jgi:hypothetical protein